ncbi:Hypothetical predicted protein [Olea europaea subsp. europaea]|uniref:Uncharacterized protein n=1 Tax=Olea europaea subsp. europaea TaxID=158383 RepID=A0A8S0VBH4_OLEEU|nr:Hypothetical predicted protein [Olea europaea subsp. europaea]CAA3028415.1 Hypothetical predicted protein [Olea europaea subsp. europaea]
MAGRVPVEVGTRGTVGSLLKREIEYFKRLDLDRFEMSSLKSERHVGEIGSGRSNSWPSFKLFPLNWRRKKRRNTGIRPSMCSMVEVVDGGGMSEIPGFSYRNLKADSKRFEDLNK